MDILFGVICVAFIVYALYGDVKNYRLMVELHDHYERMVIRGREIDAETIKDLTTKLMAKNVSEYQVATFNPVIAEKEAKELVREEAERENMVPLEESDFWNDPDAFKEAITKKK